MSTSAGAPDPWRWRPLERIGHGMGCAAGGAVLLLLWIFSLSSDLRAALVPSKRRR